MGLESKKPTKTNNELWDEIGFHKILGGFWYRLSFMLASMVLSIAIAGYFLGFFYPYPESASYRSIASSIFMVLFQLFDLGTHMVMDRYIAESQIKNPDRMLHYIQYFIWYQMITGLIQTTIISIYALFFVPKSDLGYMVWLILIISTTQYPGFLGVFRGVLGSLQQFNKKEILNFVSGELFQRITEIVFLLLGRSYGSAHPEIGELMGIAIGSAIGLYIDDFFATLLSAYYFSKVMKDQNISAKDCFRPDFNWDIIKDPFFYGLKTGAPFLVYTFSNWAILMIWLNYVPQYTTFIAFSSLAMGISGLINLSSSVSTTPLISEAYLNGKKKLTQYYAGQMIRFSAFIQGFILSTLLIVILVLEDAFVFLNLQQYLLAIPFILPQIVRNLQQPYTTLADNIILGTNHPNFFMFICIIQDIFRYFFIVLFVIWLEIPSKYGISAIIWLMPCWEYGAIMIKTVWMYVFINKKIIKIQVPWWQTLGSTAISTSIVLIFDYLVKIYVFDTLNQNFGFIVAAVVSIVLFLTFMIVLYGPLTGLFGGWDDMNLNEFEKAARMSGPSKFMVWPLYRLVNFSCNISPMHNKYGMDSKDAIIEAEQLLRIKISNRKKSQ